MSYRRLSLVIMTCVFQLACSASAPRAVPAATAEVARTTSAQLCSDTGQTAPVQLSLADQTAKTDSCGPCGPGKDCHCGEDFCTSSSLPCP